MGQRSQGTYGARLASRASWSKVSKGRGRDRLLSAYLWQLVNFTPLVSRLSLTRRDGPKAYLVSAENLAVTRSTDLALPVAGCEHGTATPTSRSGPR